MTMVTIPERAENGSRQMRRAWREHWPEYLMEGAELGIFMMSACLFGTLLEYPASPVRQAIADPMLRRLFMGLAMALTAVSLIYSPWGKQSGAHLNPAVTLAFFRLGKVTFWDALFYIVAHVVGGVSGVLIAAVELGHALAEPPVHYVVTSPGTGGAGVAFVAEMVMTFILMSVVLAVTNTPKLARYTGLFAGALVALYITLEAPLSGMSLNPARTFGSALSARSWTALWVYLTAPVLGMLLAAEWYRRRHGLHRVLCAKLHHHNSKRCIFKHCGYQAVRHPLAKKQQLPQTSLPSERRLTCQEVTNLIVDYVTGDLAAATRAAFEAHLRGCKDCEAFLNTYRETIRLTRAVRCEDLPADMLKRVEGFLQGRLKGS